MIALVRTDRKERDDSTLKVIHESEDVYAAAHCHPPRMTSSRRRHYARSRVEREVVVSSRQRMMPHDHSYPHGAHDYGPRHRAMSLAVRSLAPSDSRSPSSLSRRCSDGSATASPCCRTGHNPRGMRRRSAQLYAVRIAERPSHEGNDVRLITEWGSSPPAPTRARLR